MLLKRLGALIAVIGGIFALFSSLSFFFTGHFMGHMNYNQIDTMPTDNGTIIGIFAFIIAIIALLIALLAFKHHYTYKIFASLFVLGIVLTGFTLFISGVLILLGGVFGGIGIATSKAANQL